MHPSHSLVTIRAAKHLTPPLLYSDNLLGMYHYSLHYLEYRGFHVFKEELER
ncbi:BgTH12-03396 [Blumeria graminis f. sp. triticale]|uniref:BgTH12-03396 n=1 Tax=Blumeria graminis f. sp. triticale TaxID=1689686 RepID=A0A9W4CVK3_BLUGR|nr:BgTH12-03396 [Blumeria graminis f. sp. triticale]